MAILWPGRIIDVEHNYINELCGRDRIVGRADSSMVIPKIKFVCGRYVKFIEGLSYGIPF